MTYETTCELCVAQTMNERWRVKCSKADIHRPELSTLLRVLTWGYPRTQYKYH